MAAHEPTAEFHRDPFQYLDGTFPAAGDSVWLPDRQLLLSEAAASRAVLANEDGLYEDHSDFFHIRRGTFGPRSAQVEIGRSARALLRAQLRARAGGLPGLVERDLVPSSEWPDAGNWLIYRHLAPALAGPDSPPRLLGFLDGVVRRGVLAGARKRHSWLSRTVFRYRVLKEIGREIAKRRTRTEEPADVLDVLARAGGPEARPSDLAEVFLSFVFAVAGSIGFTLGWSLYLLGTHPGTEAHPAWVVREALRLWPVAWLMARRPARPHEVGGVAVTPEDEVLVCPYAVHRNPRHWEDPDAFRPERWAGGADPQAFIPFGWGAHRCVAGSLSLQLAEDVLTLLLDRYELRFEIRDTRPGIAAALSPPRFTLGLTARPWDPRKEGE